MKQFESYRVLGLMSGTSMDGLDMCLAKINITENHEIDYEIIKVVFEPFDKKTKLLIREAINGENIIEADKYLGILFLKFCQENFKDLVIDAIALHGQTIAHEDGIMTKQIGNPKYLAKI